MLRNIKDFSTLSTVYPVVPVETPSASVKANGWTPGPWYVVKTTVETYVRDKGGMIAHGPYPSKYEGQLKRFEDELAQYYANANLIAAAPALYEALENLLSVTSGYSEYIRNARAALAKARGE